ncbi:exocyst complex component 1 family protein [Ancylostoma caninum]|uniref:Exocyst complex component 1 family protein n=1 Tax=Ancylostoma caninum TaxID=29170 RepID=A0A368FJD1_ANCCA|nr:exocyst complex component 1 family protein [Ancylostoma caninum]
MSAIRKGVQRQLFQTDDERLHAIVHVVRVDGRKKKRPTFFCLAVTIEHPISVRLYFVKGEKDDAFKKRNRFYLRDVKEVDGINPKKALPDFHITIGDHRFSITASTPEEKDEFIRELYKLSAQYLPVQMPDFCNVSIPIDNREISILPIETADEDNGDIIHDYQPVSAKEEADFRRLLLKAELTIGEADRFSEVLSAQLQSLDGANIQSMMGSEMAVNQLLSLLDGALDKVALLEKEIDICDAILAHVRNSVELIEEKDSLSAVERKNKDRLQQELTDFVAALDTVTDNHIRTLKEANLNDAGSIARCAEAARAVSHFWNGCISKSMLQMKAYEKRNRDLAVIDLFVDRFMSHLSAIFNNLNDFSLGQDWHSLSIPKQSQRFHALSPLSDLISWLKANRPTPYNAAIQRYVESTKTLYKRHFDTFFEAVIGEVQKLGSSDKRLNSSNLSAKSSVDRQSLSLSDISAEYGQVSALIETVLGELGPIIEMEQKFCVRFFHINSELISNAETTSTDSGESAIIGGRNAERFMNEQVRSVMASLFESLNGHLERFCTAIRKQNPSNVMLLFIIMSKKVLLPQESGSYYSVTFGTFVVLIKRQFDSFMESEGQALSDIKIPKRVRLGILPTIERFADFVRTAESIFEGAERRTDLEKWYIHLYRCVCEGIEKAASNPNSKSPTAVVRFENYHQLYLTLSELKIPFLDAQRKDAKREKEENIDLYVREYMGRPLEKIHVFFEAVQNAIEMRGTKADEISYQPQFSRVELKKVIAMYPGKEVKKGLEQLYKKVEKHLVDHSSLLQVVWREMQDQFLKQLQGYQRLMATCYPGSKIELEVSVQDVLSYFSDIAQQH